MSDNSTTRMIEMYMDQAEAPMFLSGFFKTPPRNIHDSEKVEIDIMRDDEEVAVVVQDLTVEARHNEATTYQNKAWTPPIYKEQGAIHAYNMIKRQPGSDPFSDPNFGVAATDESFRIFRKLGMKIRRAIEWQSAQVLQTGQLTLVNEAGVALYTLDFQPKSSHMETVTTSWALDGTTGDPLTDLGNLAQVVRQDGKRVPTDLIFGRSAWRRFLANAKVKQELERDKFARRQLLAPTVRGGGGSFVGIIDIDYYSFNMWLYGATFRHPQTNEITTFVDDENVIMMSEEGRLDLSYGSIPRIVGPETRALPFLPSRMSDGQRGLDMTVNSWITPNGEHLMVSAGTRPLTIPTAIDTFARLNVTA